MSNSTSNSYFSCRGWFREILRIHFLQVYLVVIVPTFSKPTGPFFIRLKPEPVIVCLLVVGDVPGQYHGVQILSYLVFSLDQSHIFLFQSGGPHLEKLEFSWSIGRQQIVPPCPWVRPWSSSRGSRSRLSWLQRPPSLWKNVYVFLCQSQIWSLSHTLKRFNLTESDLMSTQWTCSHH